MNNIVEGYKYVANWLYMRPELTIGLILAGLLLALFK